MKNIISLKSILFLVGIVGAAYAVLAGVAMPLFIAFEYGWVEASGDLTASWEAFGATYLLLLLSFFILFRTLRVPSRS